MKLRLFFIALIILGTIIEITMEHRRHVRAQADLDSLQTEIRSIELSTGTLTAHPHAIRNHHKENKRK